MHTPRHSAFIGLDVAWGFGVKNKPNQNFLNDANVTARLRTMDHGLEVVSNILLHVKCSDYLAHTRDAANVTAFVVISGAWLQSRPNTEYINKQNLSILTHPP